MDRRDKSSKRSYNDDSSNLKPRKFKDLDSNGYNNKFEHSLNGISKKIKGDTGSQAIKQDLPDYDLSKETIKLVNDEHNPMLAELDETHKLKNYRICSATVKHLNSKGITHLFPIQARTFDHVYDEKDIIARDRTGSGKTLSYTLPICERFREQGAFSRKAGQRPLVLIVLPTRELAIQVSNVWNTIKLTDDEFRVTSVYGGTDIRNQIQELRKGVDIVVGTPGRLLDLIERKAISFQDLKIIVLDEADQMLDMGFQEDIEKIYKLIHAEMDKENLQSVLFSATIPSWVHDASKKFLREKHITRVDLIKERGYTTPSTVKHLAINCPYFSRNSAIGDIVLCYGGQHARTIIFTETKQEANEIMLEGHIKQECQVLHGDIPQKQREVTFKAFREGKFKCLVATNVAARGLDIPEVDLIVQLSPPKDVDTYIHRAGRTARAGRSGVCVTFYTKKTQELMDRIERKANFKFQKVGAPQPTDIIKANARDIVASIKKVPHEVVSLFDEISDELLESLGAKESLCRALAIISGTNEKFKQRSLLCSIEGFVTYIVETDVEFVSLSFIWIYLKRHFSQEITDSIKGMRSFKNHLGAAFDVPEQYESEFQAFIDNNPTVKTFTLKKADVLPEFEDEQRGRGGSGYGGYGGGGGFGGRNGGGNGYTDNNTRVLKARDDVKVFVGGLPYDAREDDIREFFKREGTNPTEVLILKDNDGNSKGVGFVIFEDANGASRACSQSGKKLKGRALRINMASDKPPGRR